MFVSMPKLTFQDQRTHQILHKFFKLRKFCTIYRADSTYRADFARYVELSNALTVGFLNWHGNC